MSLFKYVLMNITGNYEVAYYNNINTAFKWKETREQQFPEYKYEVIEYKKDVKE